MKFQSFLKFKETNPSALPPVMAQYYSFKSKYEDFIVLFRLGEFFETYFEDAINFSNAAGTVLTRKNFKAGTVLMSGIPYKKLDIYVEKLIKNDFKVVVVNQILKDGILTREVVKIYTKGTLLDLEFLDSKENNYLASLYKKNSIYEICYCDISVGDVFISSGNLEEIKCELARISPNELLVPKNLKIEESLYLPYKFEFLDDSFYEGEEDPSFLALLNYSKFILKNYTPRFEKKKTYSIQKRLLIDFITRKNLELTKNSYNNKTFGSILWALDNCKTPMGKRLLSSYISTPLFDIEEINKRYEAIEEFFQKEDEANKLSILFENLGDISRLTSRLSNETITPLEFCTLKDGLKILKETEKIISSFKAPLINQKTENKQELIEFYDILDKTIEDNIETVKSGNYIKKGANPELDVLIFKKEEYLKEIKEYETALQAYTKIKTLKIAKKAGSYSIEVPRAQDGITGGDFRLIQQLKSISRFTTAKLLDLEEKIFSTDAKIDETKKAVFNDLKKYSKNMTEYVRKYSKKLALIDVIYSFYAAAKQNSLIRPEITNDGTFEIEEGRHIAAEKIFEKYEPLGLTFKDSDFIMLTGANGSGKSTLLKEIGAIIILAQSGSFIPSKYAKLPLVDKLFTILNVSDEFINKKSTHQAQMKEASRIIENATDKSLILLDEIGKNTSYKEGIAIYYAIIRYLIEEKSAKTVFATHYCALRELFKNLKNKISYLEIVESKGKRALQEGVALNSNGILTAKEQNLPIKLINYANEALKLV